MPKKHKYFISYCYWVNNAISFHNMTHECIEPITAKELFDVQHELIVKFNDARVTILNFSKFETPAE